MTKLIRRLAHWWHTASIIDVCPWIETAIKEGVREGLAGYFPRRNGGHNG